MTHTHSADQETLRLFSVSLRVNGKPAGFVGRRASLHHASLRGRADRLVLVGQKKAVAIAVRNVSGQRRWWLHPGPPPWQEIGMAVEPR
jgi:hypothetical protein